MPPLFDCVLVKAVVEKRQFSTNACEKSLEKIVTCGEKSLEKVVKIEKVL